MPALIFLALILGLRHGIDWDHIAAIGDITGTNKDKKEGFILGSLYALGHATVVTILGLLAVVIGLYLPPWVDNIMEKVVGVTLILLGSWLLISVIRDGKNFRFKSRWMVLFAIFGKIHELFGHHHKHFKYPQAYGAKTAFSIGVLHGVGAETPTQMLLFITAAGVGRKFIGPILVFLFVAGLFVSNTFIITLSVLGYKKAEKNTTIYLILGAVAGIFSLIVGVLYLILNPATKAKAIAPMMTTTTPS